MACSRVAAGLSSLADALRGTLLLKLPQRRSSVTLYPLRYSGRRRAARMTIRINKPEVEALINQRLRSGALKDAEV
jgi:hypothetical protein